MVHPFSDRLVAAVQQKKSPICVGLDPRLENIPPIIYKHNIDEYGDTPKAIAETFIEFNKIIIDAVHDLVPVVKPQFAFYIKYGAEGVRAFAETCAYAQQKNLLVIADAKVNDIGTTAEAYGRAFLGEEGFNCDALTVNAYLGYDGVRPLVELCKKNGKGIFILVKTSNPSSGDLQDRAVDGGTSVANLMAFYVDSWGSDEVSQSGYSLVGAVAGATYPAEATKLRALMPNTYFLVPGYGAQGGGAADVKGCFNKDGLGAVINSSREINFAWEKLPEASSGSQWRTHEAREKDVGPAARAETEKMRVALQKIL